MTVLVRETVERFHTVELNEELDVEQIISKANALKKSCDNGCEALKEVLQPYLDNYDFDYEIKSDSCGSSFQLDCEYVIDD